MIYSVKGFAHVKCDYYCSVWRFLIKSVCYCVIDCVKSCRCGVFLFESMLEVIIRCVASEVR